MASLEINGQTYEGKFNFAFKNKADKEFNDVDANGNQSGGFNQIYQGLLNFDLNALKAFWLCAVASEKKQPTSTQVEAALDARIEEDNGVDQLFKEAFQEIDDAGFFRRDVKTFWKNIELSKLVLSEEELAQSEIGIQMFKDNRAELLGNKPTE